MVGLVGLSIPLDLLGFFIILFLNFYLFFFLFNLLNQGNVLDVVPVLTLHTIEPPAPESDPFAACA